MNRYAVVAAASFMVALLVAVSAPLHAQEKDKKDEKEKKRKPAFTVGKETTHVVGPLDKDGRIDYETALNDRMREGVTPENNAAVVLFKAFGPHPDDAKIPEAFFKWLGMDVPPEKGDYFVNVNQFRREHLKAKPPSNAFEETLDKTAARPWSAKEHPDVAAWLKLNEKPLAVAIEASKRTHYYYPVLGNRNKDGKTDGLISASVVGVQSCRQVATALTARAMLRMSENRHDDAWQDLLACHRLGRLTGRGGTLIEYLVGVALENIASKADLVLLDAGKLDAKKLKACLRDLQDLPARSAVADKMDLTERFWALETVMLIDRDSITHLENIAGSGGNQDLMAKIVGKWITSDVQWDPALRNFNLAYDRSAAAMRLQDRSKRDKELQQIETDIRALKVSLTEAKDIARTILGAKSIGEAKGKYIGDVMICLLMPATIKVQHAADRAEQTQRNLHLAFALAAYKADEGRYPKKLDALAPKYLATVPNDLFSGKALIYRPSDTGYLLYSVGVNGQDDEGRGVDDDPRGDDLPLRMPLPKLREKE